MAKDKPIKYCKNKKCIYCGTKEQVQHTTDMYNSDLHGDTALYYICDTCNQNHADDL